MPALAPVVLALSLAVVGVPHHQRHPPAQEAHVPAKAGHHRAAAHRHHDGPARHAPATKASGKTAAKKAEDVEEVEDIEEIGAVDGVEAIEGVESLDVAPAAGDKGATAAASANGAQAPGDKTGLQFRVVMGHLHAAVVHLPIAWCLLWSAFEAMAIVWAHPWLLTAGLPMGLMTCLSFGPAVFSGLMRLDELADGNSGYDVTAAHLHRNLLFVAWALVLVACVLRLTVARPNRGFAARTSYVVLVWLACGLTAWSAHLGGCMVYGDDFLPF